MINWNKSLLPRESNLAKGFLQLPELIIQTNQKVAHYGTEHNWLLFSYLLIVSALLGRFIYRYSKLVHFLRQQNRSKMGEYTLVKNTSIGPGSFYKTIILPKDSIEEAILRHEIAHIEYGHFYDKMFVQLMVCFSPFILGVYFIQKELELVHEFQADAKASQESHNYSEFLVSEHFQSRQHSLIQTFFHHPLKSRIMMLKHAKPISKTRRVILLLGSFIGISYLVIVQSCKTKEPAKIVQNQIPAIAQMPEFPGGEDALYQYLTDHIIYPYGETKQGEVKVTFVVDADGSIIGTRVNKSLAPRLDSAAIAVVSNMPKWKPGKDKMGNSIAVHFQVPIKFQLD
jgi:TonB family protein